RHLQRIPQCARSHPSAHLPRNHAGSAGRHQQGASRRRGAGLGGDPLSAAAGIATHPVGQPVFARQPVMTRLVIAIIALVIAGYVLLSSIFVVNEREQAIVMRFGEITREIQEPGLYFKIPTDFVETVQYIDKRLLRYDLERIRLQVSGGQFYIVDAFVTYRISNPITFRQSVLGSLQLAAQRIATRLESALRGVYGLRAFDAALA